VTVENRDVTPADVVNTTTETTVYSFTVPGGTFGTDKALRLTLIGDYLNNSGANTSLTVRVKLGATTISSTTFTLVSSNAARRALTVTCTVSAANATNAQASSGRIALGTAGTVDGSALAPTLREGVHNSIAEDSTGDLALAVTYENSGAAATVSARALTVHLEKL
jgi:hypothetical protein